MDPAGPNSIIEYEPAPQNVDPGGVHIIWGPYPIRLIEYGSHLENGSGSIIYGSPYSICVIVYGPP